MNINLLSVVVLFFSIKQFEYPKEVTCLIIEFGKRYGKLNRGEY